MFGPSSSCGVSFGVLHWAPSGSGSDERTPAPWWGLLAAWRDAIRGANWRHLEWPTAVCRCRRRRHRESRVGRSPRPAGLRPGAVLERKARWCCSRFRGWCGRRSRHLLRLEGPQAFARPRGSPPSHAGWLALDRSSAVHTRPLYRHGDVGPGCTTLRHRVDQGFVDVAPHPVHAAFPVCLDDRVAGSLVMAEGVLILGLLATAQVTTGHAQPQRRPGVTDCDAFLTDVGGRADWLYSCYVQTGGAAKRAGPGPP